MARKTGIGHQDFETVRLTNNFSIEYAGKGELFEGLSIWQSEEAVYSLLVASVYLKVKNFEIHASEFGEWETDYELELTNFEVRAVFRNMVRGWFSQESRGMMQSY